jgi:chromate reductase, NAD(P)H dehydrogenase (quinone)
MRILGISGSLRRHSHNSRLLRVAARSLPPGAELEFYDELAAIPPFDEDQEQAPPAPVVRLQERIAAADGLLISTPEYNASIPGLLKNAVDWASRPFPDNALRDKPAAVIGTSTGLFGAVWAQAELRKVLRHAGAHVLDEELPVPTADMAFGPDGELAIPELQERLSELLQSLAREATAPLEEPDAPPAPRQPAGARAVARI